MIAARPSSIPYLSALLPSELELQTLEETDSSEQDDQTDSENTPGNNLNVSQGQGPREIFNPELYYLQCNVVTPIQNEKNQGTPAFPDMDCPGECR